MHNDWFIDSLSSSVSSSSSSDELNFILEEFSDDTLMLETILNNKTDMKSLELAMKIRQVRQEKRASSTSQRLKKKKRFIRRYR